MESVFLFSAGGARGTGEAGLPVATIPPAGFAFAWFAYFAVQKNSFLGSSRHTSGRVVVILELFSLHTILVVMVPPLP